MYGHWSCSVRDWFYFQFFYLFVYGIEISFVKVNTTVKHTNFVQTCLKTGFKYFIVSELMLFFSFFWTFFNFYLNGSVATSYVYPPFGIGMDDKLPGIMNPYINYVCNVLLLLDIYISNLD